MVDWTKPLQTRSGLKVEFLRKLNRTTAPIIVVTFHKTGEETIATYPESGRWLYDLTGKAPLDIINVPEDYEAKYKALLEAAKLAIHEYRLGQCHSTLKNRMLSLEAATL